MVRQEGKWPGSWSEEEGVPSRRQGLGLSQAWLWDPGQLSVLHNLQSTALQKSARHPNPQQGCANRGMELGLRSLPSSRHSRWQTEVAAALLQPRPASLEAAAGHPSALSQEA